MENSFKMKLAATTTVALVCVGATYAIIKCKNRLYEAAEALKYMKINIATTEHSCDEIVRELQNRIKVRRAVGFDCEWVTEHGKRRPVALLQLATNDGYCGLFRLCHLNDVPHGLKTLLEDASIYKVGVAACDDAKYLFHDYGVNLKSTVDLRHIAELCGREAGGLAALSKHLLGIVLDKSWRTRCSDWEAEDLTQKQLMYAAADAHVAIKIFVKLLNEYHRSGWRRIFMSEDMIWKGLDRMCWNYVDINFKTKKKNKVDMSVNRQDKSKEVSQSSRYSHATRTKPLYHNCFLEAPDGEMLCTCDNKKALWYVEKQLADIVTSEPLTVRLRFEPAGRSVGVVGRYYTLVKHNRCVVCGADNSYIRKNVVPREYRKHFPDILKDHSSHDVVLLCVRCHQSSNMRDQQVRERLAEQCDAPIGDSAHGPYMEDQDLKKVRSAARALLYQSRKHTLPQPRRSELEAVLLRHYQCDDVTNDLLEEASNMEVQFENAAYESHGQKVVEHYLSNGGLLQLEQLWREHFLTSMRPQHMPELWSVTHTEDRLRVKLKEGRLSESDIRLIGLKSKWI